MKRFLIFLVTGSALCIGGSVIAQTSQPPADCSFKSIPRQRAFDAKYRDIVRCIESGKPPPVHWLDKEGQSKSIRAGGYGGYSVGARQAPEDPPGPRGKSSVSAGMFNFSMKFPPWRGFPCQLPGGIDMCGGSKDNSVPGTTPGGNDPGGNDPGGTPSGATCAAASDGTFGAQQPISAAGSVSLPCGGSVPLAATTLSLTRSATGMVIAEAGSRAPSAFRQSGSQFAPVAIGPVPTYLCDSKGERSVEVNPLAEQIMTYPASGSIALKLQRPNGEGSDPFDPEAEPDPYLVVPLRNGVPAMPQDCARDSDYYKTATAINATLTIDSGAGSGAVVPATCDAVTLYPNGTSCAGTMQFVALDRPNLVYPPASSASFSNVSGSFFMADAAAASRIYVQNDTIMYFGAGGSFVLPEGGVLKLDNGEQLQMNGPATVNAGGRSVGLTNGGSVLGPDGTLKQALSSGSSYSPQVPLPYVVRVTRNVELPAGMMAPTASPAYIRLPLAAK